MVYRRTRHCGYCKRLPYHRRETEWTVSFSTSYTRYESLYSNLLVSQLILSDDESYCHIGSPRTPNSLYCLYSRQTCAALPARDSGCIYNILVVSPYDGPSGPNVLIIAISIRLSSSLVFRMSGRSALSRGPFFRTSASLLVFSGAVIPSFLAGPGVRGSVLCSAQSSFPEIELLARTLVTARGDSGD